MSGPMKTAPIKPPSWRVVPINTAVDELNPMRVESSGSQFARKKRLSKLAKLIEPEQQGHQSPAVAEEVRKRATSAHLLRLSQMPIPAGINARRYTAQQSPELFMVFCCNDRNRSNSGSRQYITAAIPSGSTPPTRKTDRQPPQGISDAAIKPPAIAPPGEPAGDPHQQRRTLTLRAVFACQRDRVSHHPADAEPGQKAKEDQLLHGHGRSRTQHAQAEECRRSDEHRPSANTIGKNAQQHRAKQHAKEPRAKNGAKRRRVDDANPVSRRERQIRWL